MVAAKTSMMTARAAQGRPPKLSRSLRHTSRAKALMAPGYWTGSSSTTCANSPQTVAQHQAQTAAAILTRQHRVQTMFVSLEEQVNVGSMQLYIHQQATRRCPA